MTSRNALSPTITVFAGPSLPESLAASRFVIRPPASRGDLLAASTSGTDVIVFLDGVFQSRASVGHLELLGVVSRGAIVIGAASMGALRAVDLRHHGVIGCGTAYRAVLNGFVTDDSELAVAMCPFTYAALTVSLIEIRRLLALASDAGCSTEDTAVAYAVAESIFFMERTQARLTKAWTRTCHRPEPLLKLLGDDRVAIKRQDGAIAIQKALNPSSQPGRVPEEIYWGGHIVAV
jgi:hypothetical protein